MPANKLTDAELIKELNAQRDYDIFKTGADYHHAGQAAERITELSAKLARFKDCHVWEPGVDNLKNMHTKLEVLIPVHLLRDMIGTDELTIRLPCPQNTPVFVVQKAYCDKRDQDKCSEYCDGWDEHCPDNKAELEIIKQPFALNMISKFGKTVFLSEAAAITAKALLEKEVMV